MSEAQESGAEVVAAADLQHAPGARVEPDYRDLSDMARWARDARDVSIMAARLVETEFVPAAYQGRPAEATAAILTGIEVGLQPMAALRSIVSVNGTPAMVALALRGLVQSHGHTIRVESADATQAVVVGWRKGETEADAQRSVWTIERAAKLGLTNKANWKSQPQNMLVARATSECARLVASDVLMGVPYSAEELQDAEPAPAKEEPIKVPVPSAPRLSPATSQPTVVRRQSSAPPSTEPPAPARNLVGPAQRSGTSSRPAAPHDWVRDARRKTTEAEVKEIWHLAEKAGASAEVLDQILQISSTLPVKRKPSEAPAGGWPETRSEDEADAVEAELVEEAEEGRAAPLDPETEEEPF